MITVEHMSDINVKPFAHVQTSMEPCMTQHLFSLQVKHKRLNLLQHPLISRYITCNWWRLSPFFFIYLLMYAVFLVLLTAFALNVPRPGPDNQNCELHSILI